MVDEGTLFVGSVLLGLGKVCWAYLVLGRRPPHAVRVGEVTELLLYPVKSCGALSLPSARCTYTGLQHPELGVLDRHFMVVSETGNMLTGRGENRLVTVRLSLNEDCVKLTAPGMPSTLTISYSDVINNTEVWSCRVWGENVEGLNCGLEAQNWFTQLLGKPAHLVYAAPFLQKRELPTCGTSYWHKITRPQDNVAFADFAPYMLISESSLSDLNSRLSHQVDMRNFRANIVVKANKPYDEDYWEEIFIGETKFVNLKPCERCVFTTVNPNTGIKSQDKQPLKLLQSYRLFPGMKTEGPHFGVNLFLDWEGAIKIGDPVYATRKS